MWVGESSPSGPAADPRAGVVSTTSGYTGGSKAGGKGGGKNGGKKKDEATTTQPQQ